MRKLFYFSRIFNAYILKKKSQLTFWHGKVGFNNNANYEELDEFYQLFDYKANYPGPFNKDGVILLDYHGLVGVQKYHIAISQYGLACYNQYKRTGKKEWYEKFMAQVKWHENNLLKNDRGIYLWYANFDWDYHGIQKKPWASGLAQGNGLSLLTRAYIETRDEKYLDLCEKVFKSIITEIKDGGVMLVEDENYWIEEMLNPPKHILNGFMWALMGVYDYYLLTKDNNVKYWFDKFINTLETNLHTFDTGYWSLYEHAGTKIPMLASYFYHSLHIVQLKILYKMTNRRIFEEYANKWEKYMNNRLYKTKAFIIKSIFKLKYF